MLLRLYIYTKFHSFATLGEMSNGVCHVLYSELTSNLSRMPVLVREKKGMIKYLYMASVRYNWLIPITKGTCLFILNA